MMHRLSSLMVALWFALYVGAPQLLHPCPQHAVQGVGSEAKPGHHAVARPAGEHSVTAHDAAHQSSAATATPGDAGHSHGDPQSGQSDAPAGEHDCCCPGPQCGSAAIVVALQTPWISVSIVDADVAIDAPPFAPATTRVAHTLPYATAPPVTALA